MLRTGRHRLHVALVLIGLVPSGAWARPLQPLPPLCDVGRFLVPGAALVVGSPAATDDVVTVASGAVAVASGCPAAHARLKAKRSGTRIRVIWSRCPGMAGRATLKGLIHPGCGTLDATFAAPRAKVRRQFTASRSTCGDGVVDAAGGETCDGAGTCPGGSACPSDCICGGEGPVCGNGRQEAAEQCDDGNGASGDGCSATCEVETTLVSEVEPNNLSAKANRVDVLPAVVQARIAPGTDQDYFAFAVPAGGHVEFETFDASGVTCDGIDTYVELCDTDGVTALQFNDDGGIDACSKLDSVALAGGIYFARVLSTNTVAINGYRLRIAVH